MKKFLSVLLIVVTLLTAAGCGDSTAEIILVPDEVLSPVAIYSMATDILQNPKSYAGKSVQAEGEAVVFSGTAEGSFIRISDSTACCFVEIEYAAPEGLKLPEEATVFQLFGTISSYKNEEGKEVPRFDVEKFIYEDELREMYEEEME